MEPDAPPVMPPVTVGEDQLKVVPVGTTVVGGLFIGVALNVDPVQIVLFCAGIIGAGATIIVRITVSFWHELFDTIREIL